MVKMLRSFFSDGDALSKTEYPGDKKFFDCYWPDFSFSFSDEEMDTSSDSGSSPTNQHIVPFALGQVKKLFTKPSHRKHLLTSDIQNNDCKNIFHCHKKYILAKFHSFFKNTNEFKFYALIKHAWKQSKTDRRLTDPLTNRVIYRALENAVEQPEWPTSTLTTEKNVKILFATSHGNSPLLLSNFSRSEKLTFPFEHRSQHLIPAYVSL